MTPIKVLFFFLNNYALFLKRKNYMCCKNQDICLKFCCSFNLIVKLCSVLRYLSMFIYAYYLPTQKLINLS